MRIRQLLVVHPSRSIRALLKKIILSDCGDLEVEQAAGGQEASELLAAAWFDIVLTDIDLTDIPPERIKTAYEAHSKNKDLSIIAIAEGGNDHLYEDMAAKGFEHFVVPPFEPEVLNKKINTLCNPRQWRKADRYHFPDSKVNISVWGMDAEAVLINLSMGGVLVEVAGDRSELFLQNNPKLSLKIKVPGGYNDIANIPAKLARLNAIEWHPNYKPSVMRIVYVFLEINPSAHAQLERMLQAAADNPELMPDDP